MNIIPKRAFSAWLLRLLIFINFFNIYPLDIIEIPPTNIDRYK
tara:strand:+ start:127 stop:255 length:129 start_codon:yes stop_codon:yes gene_type:complete